MNCTEEKVFRDQGQVHVWIFNLSGSDRALEHFRRQLSRDEIARSERFCFPHLQTSFVVAHGMLRNILASYLGLAPAALEFSYNQQGKPRLADTGCRLRFNLSHSGTLGACAVAADCDLGVDIEHMRQMADLFDIARRFFSPEECGDLEAVPHDQQQPAFFNCWTRKEAYIKAVGGGLSIPLESFRVSLAPNEPARLISNCENDAHRWNIQEFDPGADYRGAVAYSGPPRDLVVRRIEAEEAAGI
ncbi:MAG TPA: 4'-phosphopantetheinyl transferase superfamily protein [Bryobacteraceae bacterium]|nr:4'-phosphopantetheinyl transferase superfamily protein [Bryobacteraceae bacterium]